MAQEFAVAPGSHSPLHMPDYLRRFRKRRFKLTFDIPNLTSLTKIKDFLANFTGVYKIVLTAAMEGLMGAPSIIMMYPG